MSLSKTQAQQRADRINAFQDELAQLAQDGVLDKNGVRGNNC